MDFTQTISKKKKLIFVSFICIIHQQHNIKSIQQ